MIRYPFAGLFTAARAIERICQKLRQDATTLGAEDQVMSFEKFNHLIGVEEKYALAERYGAE